MPRTFRACWSSYLVITICIGIIPAIATPFALRRDKGAAQIAAIGFAALVFAYFWLSRFRLVIIQFRSKARLRQWWLSSFSLDAVGFLPPFA